MKFTELAKRVSGDGADAWDVHFEAVERQRSGRQTVILTVGQETSEPTPSLIVDAAFESLKAGRHHYSEISGEPELRSAIADVYTRDFGSKVTDSNCAVFAGAQNALFATSLCVLESTDEAIIIEPYYATYPATFAAGGARLVTVATNAQNNFQFDVDAIHKKISDRTRAIVINSPNNPSGVVYDRIRVEELLDLCRANDIWLISDEVYATLAAPGSHFSPASLDPEFQHCITISSISKSHRMTGWRLGWAIAHPSVVRQLHDLSLCMAYGLPMFIQDAAVTAVRAMDRISTKVRNEIDDKRAFVSSLLQDIEGISVRGSQVGMFVIIDVRDLGVDDKAFAWRLLDDFEVAILPCTAFGKSGKYLLRINVGDFEFKLQHACEKIRECATAILDQQTKSSATTGGQ